MHSCVNETSATPRVSGNSSQVDSIKKLLCDWVARGADSPKAPNYLMLALQYNLEDVGLDVAKTLIQKKGVSADVLSTAILTVGRFGSKEDQALLEPLLADPKTCHTWHDAPVEEFEQVQIQIRDVALATLVHLTGQSHDDYGFTLLRRYQRTLFHVHTLGFADNDQREAMMKKWDEWSRAEAKK